MNDKRDVKENAAHNNVPLYLNYYFLFQLLI